VTVSDPKVVDLVSFDPLSETVILSMVEEREWGDQGQLLPDLQAKLNTYLAYVEGGQLIEDYPGTANARVVFRLHYLEEIGSKEREFIRIVCQQYLFPAGIGWEQSRIPVNNPLPN
jgi:hypothetical protein